jgi:sortase A
VAHRFFSFFMLTKTLQIVEEWDIAPPNYPRRIRIPSLAVNTQVQQVGITYRGSMASPTNYKEVGWYKYGTIPGHPGSAAIAGYVDNSLAMPAVFRDLDKIAAGEKIFIDTIDGKTLRFEVTGKKVYDFHTRAGEVFAESEEALLKLITYSGSLQPDHDTHAERLVVTAKMALE